MIVESVMIVVGAGLAGLAVSLGLAQNGHTVLLVEKQPDFSRTGATLGVKANGLKALKELCPELLEAFYEKGTSTPGSGLALGWWAARDALLERVQKCDNIHLHMGWTLQDMDNGVDSVKAVFVRTKVETESCNHENKSEEESLELDGSFLIGADGVNSVVRELLGLKPATSAGVSVWRGRVKIEEGSSLEDLLTKGLEPIGSAAFGPAIFAAFNHNDNTKADADRIMTWVVTAKQHVEYGTHPWTIMQSYAEQQAEKVETVQSILQIANPKDLHRHVDLRVVELPQENGQGWGGANRVTIIGDAAHAIRPASGLGASLAFEDCCVLCRSFRNKQNINPADTILDFENSRLERVRRIWKKEWEISEAAYRGEPPQPWSDEYRNWVHNGV